MPKTQFGRRIAESAVFAQLKRRAADYLRNPDRLKQLTRDATAKAHSLGRQGPLRDVWTSLMAFFRLIRAFAAGEYRQVPWQSLTLIVAAVLYVLLPIDVIPDFIVGVGYIDDVAVIAWVMNAVRTDIDAFLKWESTRDNADAQTG